MKEILIEIRKVCFLNIQKLNCHVEFATSNKLYLNFKFLSDQQSNEQ